MKIAFHSNQLCLRGTEVALYDYAHFNEVLLGNSSIVVTPRTSPYHEREAVERFISRFPVLLYNSAAELETILQKEGVDVLYCIKAGFNDGLVATCCKTVVHCVFKYYEPHGQVYAYISKWLANDASGGACPFVPHMVHLPDDRLDLRGELGIPPEAVVFGRHGGSDTFDLSFVHLVVREIAAARQDIYFLFLNTLPFCELHPRIIHLPGTADVVRKTRFINSCDAMLHARHSGETFGLSIGEFSIRNKPIVTWTGSHERAHLGILGDKGIYYNSAEQLIERLMLFEKHPEKSWDCYSSLFAPAAVMEQFNAVFLSS